MSDRREPKILLRLPSSLCGEEVSRKIFRSVLKFKAAGPEIDELVLYFAMALNEVPGLLLPVFYVLVSWHVLMRCQGIQAVCRPVAPQCQSVAAGPADSALAHELEHTCITSRV
jgi:hypothetical protein